MVNKPTFGVVGSSAAGRTDTPLAGVLALVVKLPLAVLRLEDKTRSKMHKTKVTTSRSKDQGIHQGLTRETSRGGAQLHRRANNMKLLMGLNSVRLSVT